MTIWTKELPRRPMAICLFGIDAIMLLAYVVAPESARIYVLGIAYFPWLITATIGISLSRTGSTFLKKAAHVTILPGLIVGSLLLMNASIATVLAILWPVYFLFIAILATSAMLSLTGWVQLFRETNG